MNIVYIIFGYDSAIPSQVFSLLNQFSDQHELDVALLYGFTDRDSLETVQRSKAVNLSQKVLNIRFKCYPFLPLFDGIQLRSLQFAIQEASWHEETVFHVRGEKAGFFVSNALERLGIDKRRMVLDVRGAYYEEMRDFYKAPYFIRWWKLYSFSRLKKAFANAGAITVLSFELKKYVLQRYPFLEPEKIHIVHAVAGVGFQYDPRYRLEDRKKMGVGDDEMLLIFSTGGGGKWQQVELIAEQLAALKIRTIVLSKKKISSS